MRRVLTVALLLLCSAASTASTASAQDTAGYTVDAYLELRTSLDAADAELAGVGEDDVLGRVAAVDSLISSVHELIAYLNGWSESGTMPVALEVEARAQRFVLFENLVQLYSDLGNCQAARSALEAMRILDPESLGPDTAALRWSSQRVVEDCAVQPLVVERAERRMSPVPGRVVTLVGGATLLAGGLVFGVDAAAARSYRDEVEVQEALWTVTRDAILRDEHARLQRNQTIGRALLIAGGALTVSGITLWSVAAGTPDRPGPDVEVRAGLGFGRLNVSF